MSSALRKCISFGARGTINPVPGEQQNIGYYHAPTASYPNFNIITDSQTRWVKIWVDLFTLWPSDTTNPNAPGPVNAYLRDRLDYQIAQAKVYNCGVILTVNHRLPQWINNSTNAYQMPSDTSETGPYATALAALMSHYSLMNPGRSYSGFSYVDMFEFCNEPKLTWDTGGGDLYATVATLFKRARQFSTALRGSPLAVGPGTADADDTVLTGNRNYYNFTINVLNNLASNGFYNVINTVPGVGTFGDNCCLWSQHNYADVTFDQGPDTVAPDRTTHRTGVPQFDRYHLRSLITTLTLSQYGWKGWPNGQNTDPRIALTEGGSTRQTVVPRWGIADSQFLDYQAFLMARNLQRVGTDIQGLGCEIMTQYLTFTASTYDCGMFEETNLTARPVYGLSWKPFPGRL